MKLITRSADLHKALKNVSRGVATKTTLPILQNVHLDAADGALTITGTNLEIALRVRIAAEVDTFGAWTLPAKQLTEWIGVDTDDSAVTISREIAAIPEVAEVDYPEDTDSRTISELERQYKDACRARLDAIERRSRGITLMHTATMSDGTMVRSRSVIIGHDAEDFPCIPSSDGASHLGTVRAGDLVTLLGDLHMFAATDDSRPILAGIHLTPYDYDGARSGYLHGYATDGYRASSSSIGNYTDLSVAEPITLPARAAKSMLPILKDVPAHKYVLLSVTAPRNQLTAEVDGVQIVSRLIDGAYNVDALRAEFARPVIASAEIKRADLDKLLKRALALVTASNAGMDASAADKRGAIVTFSGTLDELHAASNGADDSIAANLHGAAIPSHTYYAKQIADTARTFSDKTITLNFCDGMVRMSSSTSAGDRIVSRVMTAIERTRRDARKIGSACSWTIYNDGAHTKIGYGYGVPSAEKYASDIAYRAAGHAEKIAELDAVMSDAWEGYAEPITSGIVDARTDAEQKLLDAARAYYGADSVAEVRYLDGSRDTITFTDEIDATAHIAALNGVASAEVRSPAIVDADAVQTVSCDPTAIVAEVDAAPILLIAARSAVNESIVPYGLPIAEDCTSADAIAQWRVYCAVRTSATKVYERDNSRRYRFGDRLTICHELAFTWPHDAYPQPLYIAVWTRDADGHCVSTVEYPTLDAAYTAMLGTIPARAARPPGIAISRRADLDAATRIWRYELDAARQTVAEVDAARTVTDAERAAYIAATRTLHFTPSTSADRRGMFDTADLPRYALPVTATGTYAAFMSAEVDGAQWRELAARFVQVADDLHEPRAAPSAEVDAIPAFMDTVRAVCPEVAAYYDAARSAEVE